MLDRTMLKCSIEGCERVASVRGWCSMHYQRWKKHGDPLAGATQKGAAESFYESALKHEGTECLTWPFATLKGYAILSRKSGESGYVHRRICTETHGPPPTAQHEAAHSCGKGSNGCINRHHLRWATPKENNADKLLHGTHNRGEAHYGAILRHEEVAQIIELGRDHTHQDIADMFLISRRYVGGILDGSKWNNKEDEISTPRRPFFEKGTDRWSAKLSEVDVRQIRTLRGSLSVRAIAKRFKVAPSTITAILTGRTWSWLK